MHNLQTITILCISIFVISGNCSRLYEKTCGILYDESNLQGKSLEIKESNSFSNLGETYITRDTVWNVTKSFQVDKSCLLTVCNESYFDGECQVFGANVSETPLKFDSVLSVNCTCDRECKCSDVQIRSSSSSCARGYIKKGCNTCNALYTEFKGNQSWAYESFQNSITSIIVKKGCSLTIYEEEDFDGEEMKIDGATLEHWNRTISSYECFCLEGSQMLTQKRPRPDGSPPFIDVPLSADNISAMLHTELGTLSGNRYHPGLIAALKSIKGNRSPRNAYILVLGLTGAGKRSAIDTLFDFRGALATEHAHLATRYGRSSYTSGIHEFRIPTPIDHLGIQNSELRIINVPGLGDTRGLEQDARCLATLEEYLNGHEELSTRIPNIVLVFAKFHDNRFALESSSFVTMLRGIDAFRYRITDKNFSNVIFVLTHYMSETKAVRRRPGGEILRFKNVIDKNSLLPKPILIVVAENRAAEQELPMMNGNYLLPNGDLYPRNIFSKIEFVTLNGNDPIGDGVIRSAYSRSQDFNVTRTFIEVGNAEQRKAVKYFGVLTVTNPESVNTEIHVMLARAHNLMDLNLARKYPDALPYLERFFNIRNIYSATDLPKTQIEKVKFMRDIKHNEATSFLMETAFLLKAPDFEFPIITGYGYDITSDRAVITSPFEMKDLRNSEIGYRISKIINCKTNAQTNSKTFFSAFANEEDYFTNRLKYFNISYQVSSELFIGEIKPGSNVLNSSNSKGTLQPLTALKEFQTFELILNDTPPLTNKFVTLVKALSKFNSSDPESVKIWTNFFNEFGTHVVKSTYGGGSIEVQTVSNPLNQTEDTLVLSEIMAFLDDPTIEKQLDINLGSNEVNLEFQGGDTQYYVADLLKLSLDDALEVFKKWKESLLISPVILDSEIQLVPISEVAAYIGHNYSLLIQSASQEMLSSKSKSRPGNTNQSEREGRVETGSVLNYDIFQFTRDFKEIVGSNPRSDPRMTDVLNIMQQNKVQGWEPLENERLPLVYWIREQYQIRALRESMDPIIFRDRMNAADKKLSDAIEKQKKSSEVKKQSNYDAQLKILRAAATNLERKFKLGFSKIRL